MLADNRESRSHAIILLLSWLLYATSGLSQSVTSNSPNASQYELPPAEVSPIQRMWAEQRNRENQDRNRLRVEIPRAGQDRAVNQSTSLFTRVSETDSQSSSRAASPESHYQDIILWVALILIGIFAVRKFGAPLAEFLNSSSNAWAAALPSHLP